MNELDPYLQETFVFFEIGPIFFFVEPEQVGEISKKSGNPGIFVQQIQGFELKTVPIYRFSDKVEKVFCSIFF